MDAIRATMREGEKKKEGKMESQRERTENEP